MSLECEGPLAPEGGTRLGVSIVEVNCGNSLREILTGGQDWGNSLRTNNKQPTTKNIQRTTNN